MAIHPAPMVTPLSPRHRWQRPGTHPTIRSGTAFSHLQLQRAPPSLEEAGQPGREEDGEAQGGEVAQQVQVGVVRGVAEEAQVPAPPMRPPMPLMAMR